jgi:hypothetical protein
MKTHSPELPNYNDEKFTIKERINLHVSDLTVLNKTNIKMLQERGASD